MDAHPTQPTGAPKFDIKKQRKKEASKPKPPAPFQGPGVMTMPTANIPKYEKPMDNVDAAFHELVNAQTGPPTRSSGRFVNLAETQRCNDGKQRYYKGYSESAAFWGSLYCDAARQALQASAPGVSTSMPSQSDPSVFNHDHWKRGVFLWLTEQEASKTLGTDEVTNEVWNSVTNNPNPKVRASTIEDALKSHIDILNAQKHEEARRLLQQASSQQAEGVKKTLKRPSAMQSAPQLSAIASSSSSAGAGPSSSSAVPPFEPAAAAPPAAQQQRVVKPRIAMVVDDVESFVGKSPGLPSEQATRFRVGASVLTYTSAEEASGEMLRALMHRPTQQVSIPIIATPYKAVQTSMAMGTVLCVKEGRIGPLDADPSIWNQPVIIGSASLNTEAQAWHGFVKCIQEMRRLGSTPTRHKGFKFLAAGTFNSVWEVEYETQVAIPKALRAQLVAPDKSKRSVIRISLRPGDRDDVVSEAAAMLEAARDGFSLNVDAMYFEAIERDKTVFETVSILSRAVATVQVRLEAYRYPAFAFSAMPSYLFKMQNTLLKMSLRRSFHMDLSSNNLMDTRLDAPSNVRTDANAHSQALAAIGKEFDVHVIDLDGSTYRKVHVFNDVLLQRRPWLEEKDDDEDEDRDDECFKEGWRPVFLFNFLFASTWMRLMVDEATFSNFWYANDTFVSQNPTAQTPGRRMRELLAQFRAEIDAGVGGVTGDVTRQRIGGRKDEEFEEARAVIQHAKWTTKMRMNDTRVDRPDGNDAASIATSAVGMLGYYVFSYWSLHGESKRWVDEMYQYHRTKLETPNLRAACAWYDNVYLPKILPSIHYFYRRNVASGSVSAGPPALLVDVVLDYLNADDRMLQDAVQTGFGSKPRSSAEWMHVAKTDPAFNQQTARQLLSFP